MALTKSTIGGTVVRANEVGLIDATLVWRLSGVDSEGGAVIVPGEVSAVLTEDGEMPAGFTIWRNTEGLRGTFYRLTLTGQVETTLPGFLAAREIEIGTVQVGDEPSYDIAELINNPVPATPEWNVNLNPAEYAELLAQIAAAGVARDEAEVAENAARAARDQAQGHAATAEAAADAAEDDAAQAVDSAGQAMTAASDAEAAELAAVAAQAGAEAARDAAQLAAGLYGSTVAGLAGTSLGAFFTVPSGDSDEFLLLYRHDAGPVATLIKVYPAAGYVQAVADDLAEEVAARVAVIVGEDGGGLMVRDPGGFVALRLTQTGGLRTMLHDLGVDTTGGLTLQDATGFRSFRVDPQGAMTLAGRDGLHSLPGAGFEVADPGGFRGLSFRGGVLRVMGQTVVTAEGGAGAETQAILAAPAVGQARDGIRRANGAILPAWRYARGEVIAGTGAARILCLGDSNTVGGTLEIDPTVSRRSGAYPTYLARLLGLRYGATASGFLGSAGMGASYPTYDPRVALGAGWSVTGSPVSLGGETFRNSTTGNAMTFAPGAAWDRAEITVVGTGAGQIDVSIGGAATRLSIASGSVQVLTYSAASLAAHTLSIVRVSGTIDVVGLLTYSAAAPGVLVINAGRAGWQADDLADDAAFYSPGTALGGVAADLCLIEAGLNDFNTGKSLAAFRDDLQDLIDACPSGADVAILSSVTPAQGARPIPWADYVAQMQDAATDNGLPFLDMTAAMGDRAAVTAAGWVVNDLHPNRSGHAEKANVLMNLLQL